jgi:hypothetical protein
VTAGESVRHILKYIGESANPPPISPAPALRNPAALGYPPKPSWLGRSLLALSQLTHRPGRRTSRRNRSRCTTPWLSLCPISRSTRGRGVIPGATGRHPTKGWECSLHPVDLHRCVSCPVRANDPFRLPGAPLASPLVVARQATLGLDRTIGQGGNFRTYVWISYSYRLPSAPAPAPALGILNVPSRVIIFPEGGILCSWHGR